MKIIKNQNTKNYILAIRSHAKKRAIERAGFDLSRKKQKEIADSIHNFLLVDAQSGGEDIRYGYFEGKEILFVYNKGRKLVKTILPLTDSRIEWARERWNKQGVLTND